MNSPTIIIVMGVSGTGKSTLGAALAQAIHLPFIDGDDLHPPANVAKMARGEALTDTDRQPWLERLRDAALSCIHTQLLSRTTPVGVILACSALKRAYRDVLRAMPWSTWWVYLCGEKEVVRARLEGREGHFMKVGMLAGQMEVLESPVGEVGVVEVGVEVRTEEQVRWVLCELGMAPT